MSTEYVILVDKQDRELGVMEKMQAQSLAELVTMLERLRSRPNRAA